MDTLRGHIKKESHMNFGFTLHLEGAANSRQYFRYANMALRVYYIYIRVLWICPIYEYMPTGYIGDRGYGDPINFRVSCKFLKLWSTEYTDRLKKEIGV